MPIISTKKQGGFTLVEVAIVTPMITIVVLGILAMLIVLVRNNTVQSVRSSLVNDSRLALGSIEKDVETSNLFFPSTLPAATYKDFYPPGTSGSYSTSFGTLPSSTPGTTAPNILNTLFIQGYNQIVDPQDTSGTKVIAAFKGAAPCNYLAQIQANNIVSVAELYFVTNGTLYRRTLIDKTNPTACGTLQIKQGCPSGSDSNTPTCTVKDVELVRNVTQFKVDYYLNASDASAMDAYAATPSPTTIDQAKAIKVTITLFSSAAGDNITYSTALRMNRLTN